MVTILVDRSLLLVEAQVVAEVVGPAAVVYQVAAMAPLLIPRFKLKSKSARALKSVATMTLPTDFAPN